MSSKNYDIRKLEKFERAIKKKWGDEAVQNPRRFEGADKTTEEDRERYLRKLYEKHKEKEFVEEDGVKFQSEFLEQKDTSLRFCEVCNELSFNTQDTLYIEKYGVCKQHFIEYVEDREERWNNGWRPENTDDD